VLNRQLYADLSIYLADDILVKVDRMSSHLARNARALPGRRRHGARFSMPGDLKIRGGTRKYPQAGLAGALPDRILDRPKEGFSIPMKSGCVAS
jgi:asparagine synthase (glutamine-hydrolysing)